MKTYLVSANYMKNGSMVTWTTYVKANSVKGAKLAAYTKFDIVVTSRDSSPIIKVH